MSKIVNNPADRKAIIWGQSHLSKLLMFITLLCFFYILVFFYINVYRKHFLYLSRLEILREGHRRLQPLISSQGTNKSVTRAADEVGQLLLQGYAADLPNRLCLQTKCVSGMFPMKQISNKKFYFCHNFLNLNKCSEEELASKVICLSTQNRLKHILVDWDVQEAAYWSHRIGKHKSQLTVRCDSMQQIVSNT